MVAVWGGSFYRKSHLLAAAGKKRLPKHRKRGHRQKPRISSTPKLASAQRPNWQEAYRIRNQVLKQLGFIDYAAYLASDLWRSIREKVLKEARYTCYGCGGNASQVHHRCYDAAVLRGQSLGPMVAICRECHKQIETDKAGRKLSLKSANHNLKVLRQRPRHKASA